MQRANICLSYGVLLKGCISNASLAFAKKYQTPLNFYAFHFYSSDFQSFECMCVFCPRSRNRPSSCITDPKWICCSRTKKVGCFRPSAPGHYICRDGQRPHQTKTPTQIRASKQQKLHSYRYTGSLREQLLSSDMS